MTSAIDWREHLRLAWWCASLFARRRKWDGHRRRECFDDLKQEAVLALHSAAEAFDPSRGFKPSTWLASRILWHLAHWDTAHGRFFTPQHRDSYWRRHPHRLSLESQLEGLGAGRSALAIGWRSHRADRGQLTEEHLQAPDDVQAEVEARQLTSRCEEMLREFETQKFANPRHATKHGANVVRMHFGLGRNEEKTLAQVGAVLGVTPERVRQIEMRLFRWLRHGSRVARLEQFTPWFDVAELPVRRNS